MLHRPALARDVSQAERGTIEWYFYLYFCFPLPLLLAFLCAAKTRKMSRPGINKVLAYLNNS